jgi:hypothetical protein
LPQTLRADSKKKQIAIAQAFKIENLFSKHGYPRAMHFRDLRFKKGSPSAPLKKIEMRILSWQRK